MATSVLERERISAGTTDAWSGFETGLWNNDLDVRDFIQTNALSVANLDV